MRNLKDIIEWLKENELRSLTVSILTGLALLSLGIFIMGSNIYSYLGSRMIIAGSGLIYISMIVLALVID